MGIPMKTIFNNLILLTLFSGFSFAAQAQNQAAICAALEQLRIPQTKISTELISAGNFDPGPGNGAQVPEFCRVIAVVEPAITIEVWLPSPQNWNGKYKAVGGGGLAGNISYNALIPSIQDNYVTSSTDTGHISGETEWLSDAVRMQDYGYRAIHEMALKSKIFINAYYNRQSDYSYFNGCSTGGRQGLMEAQRYPDDFDGIVSGAPVNYFAATHFTQLWISEAAKPVDSTLLPPEDLAMVTRAVMAQCDVLDGVEDGILNDPRQCNFEPESLQCNNNDVSACLTAEQVVALENIYQGPVNPDTGESLHFSLEPGGEGPEGYGSWLLVGGSGVFDIPTLYYSRSVFDDADWDWRSFNFGSDIDLAMKRTGNILEATDPNLDAFQSNGGKLLIYHGWNDPLIFPQGTIAYYQSIIDNLSMSSPQEAAAATAEFARLYMVPGMAHCRGGPGTDQFDMQTAIEAWVEQGQAPTQIEAQHIENGQVTRTRPLCPYPQTAKYDGNGDINNISNFSCSI